MALPSLPPFLLLPPSLSSQPRTRNRRCLVLLVSTLNPLPTSSERIHPNLIRLSSCQVRSPPPRRSVRALPSFSRLLARLTPRYNQQSVNETSSTLTSRRPRPRRGLTPCRNSCRDRRNRQSSRNETKRRKGRLGWFGETRGFRTTLGGNDGYIGGWGVG